MLAAIVIGFLMATLGIALLFLGEVPFVGGRRIPALRSRLVGGVLVAFLPAAFGVHQLISMVFGRDTVDGPIVTWSIFGICWVAVTVILFRVLVPKQERRKPLDRSDTMTFADEEPAPEPAKKPVGAPPGKKAPAKKSAAAAPEENPFDFS